MKGKKLIYFIGVLVVGLMIYIVADTMLQPGVGDLETDFEEIGFYRNENNTGPVVRIYTVFSPDTLWQEMRQYGDFMPHTKYGKTTVYFFSDKAGTPSDPTNEEPNFDLAFRQFCIGKYEKTAMGEVRFTQFPFQ